MVTKESTASPPLAFSSDKVSVRSRLQKQLPTLLSIIAGMVDLTGFLSFGIFTAHITGNLVVIGALAVRRGHVNRAQILAIPVFIAAVGAMWLIARASRKRGPSLLRLLLVIQFLLLLCVLLFSVITKASANPHGATALIAAMIAVFAMACQFALLRLTLPVAPSTAVMTGNLTNSVLSLLEVVSRPEPLNAPDKQRLNNSLHLLLGFFCGCVVAAVAVTYIGDWAWALPTALAALAVVFV